MDCLNMDRLNMDRLFIYHNLRRILSLSVVWILTAVVPAAVIFYAGSVQVPAEAMWSEEYCRADDTTGQLSEAQRDSLDTVCLTFMETWHADLSVIALESEDYEDEDLDDYAADYYEDCGFGYGPDRDGFQIAWDMDTDEMVVVPFGAAESMVPDDYLQFVTRTAPPYRDQYGIYGPMYASMRLLDNYLKEHGTPAAGEDGQKDGGQNDAAGNGLSETDTGESLSGVSAANKETGAVSADGASWDDISADGSSAVAAGNRDDEIPIQEIPDPSLRVGEGAAMPAWYPKDPSTFPFYHDESAPRVVDTADIFTSEEEAAMSSRLAEIREELDKDIVVFTDISTYGLSREVYAADFYDFNGYGCGDAREGVVLFICMDPSSRGGWTCCTGPETRGLYTAEIADQIDDILYDYLGAGRYGEGVADWIENFRRLYISGSPYTPDWAMQDPASFTRFHDAEAPRVVDDAHLLTGEEISSLTAQAADLSEKYGLDLVIHTALHPGKMERQEYSDAFYTFNGYGYGENYDGILLTIFKRPGYTAPDPVITASGKGLEKLTGTNHDRLITRCAYEVDSKNYFNAASAWLDQTGHMLRTGRAPRSDFSWYVRILAELLAGAIFGGIALSRAKAGMAVPKVHTDAGRYLVPDSLHIRKVADELLDTREARVYSPQRTDDSSSSSGSSSGGSSYSSSYSGSSGSTHSGSGRDF